MKSLIPACLLTILLTLSATAQLSLISEDFSEATVIQIQNNLNSSTDPIWTSSEAPNPFGFEGFTVDGASPRGAENTYNGGNPLPGGLEVNANLTNATVTATIPVLPGGINTTISNNGTLTFFGINRNGPPTGDPTIHIRNVTDGVDLLASQSITGLVNADDAFPGVAAWTLKTYNVTFSASDIGDEIAVNWGGGGDFNAEGLLLADINFTAAIPESSTYAMIFGFVALGGFFLKRKFRKES